jgi:hypothetical protein
MAKRPTPKSKGIPAAAPDVPDLATPQAVFDRLLDISSQTASPESDPAIKSLAKTHPHLLVAAAPILCAALRESLLDPAEADPDEITDGRVENLQTALRGLLRLKLPFDLQNARPIFDYLAEKPDINPWIDPLLLTVPLAEQLRDDHAPDRLPRPFERCLARVRDTFAAGPCQRNERKAIERIDALLGAAPALPLKPGDPIADAVLADLAPLDAPARAAWSALLKHCSNATGTTPPKTWLKSLDALLNPLSSDLIDRFPRWSSNLASSRENGKPTRIDAANYETLKGLTWAVGALVQRGTQTDPLAAALQQLAVASYTKVPGLGRRCPKIGDAAVTALTHFPLEVAAARLTAVQRACRDPYTQETLTTALNLLSQKSNIPLDQLEELTTPTFALSRDGTKSIPLGPVTATIDISTGSAQLTYANDKGKPLKSLPAPVKRDHADTLASLKQDAKDLDKLLTSQRDRLDALLSTPRTWPVADFTRLYLDHPLVSRLARRLIWTVDGAPAIHHNNRFEDVAGRPVKITPATTVSPWHPISSTPDAVLAWRNRIEQLRITQPFKQAHREIYVLTDAERATRTYSNRFAAHLIRQHQFRALATARGWTVGYLGGWDNSGSATPTRTLPAHGLRVEFWVEPAHLPDAPTLPGGGSAFLSTDQLRFYRTGHADPLPLDQVPPLPLSEVMRDVDLFVAVCSAGNDPTWQPQGNRVGDYWHAYSFGDLSAPARTRRDVLARLLPKLKIAGRCELTDRFLVVRGQLATYNIHLGSSNIQIALENRYLCIVPDRSPHGPPDLFLPFEGDPTLAVILSKAFMLADDTAIKDPTITRQIRGGPTNG